MNKGKERFAWAFVAVLVTGLVAAAWIAGTAKAPPSETPSDSPSSQTPPAETPPAETPPAETPPAETPPTETPPAETRPATVRVRIVAANLSSGGRQSYDPGHGKRILDALDPDVVLFQELNVGDGSQAALQAFVKEALGESFSVHRETGAQIPNGIASRWPFRKVGVWEDPISPNRELVWAQIDIPGEIDLWAISVHLLTRNPSTRGQEGQVLADRVREHVPGKDYLVIGGDFNTRRVDEPVLQTLGSLVSLRHRPVGPGGRTGTNASRKRPYDWVLPDADLEAYHVAVEFGGRRFESGLVFDTRDFDAAGTIAPARPGDSGADQMQHMAVVRDFVIPSKP